MDDDPAWNFRCSKIEFEISKQPCDSCSTESFSFHQMSTCMDVLACSEDQDLHHKLILGKGSIKILIKNYGISIVVAWPPVPPFNYGNYRFHKTKFLKVRLISCNRTFAIQEWGWQYKGYTPFPCEFLFIFALLRHIKNLKC